MLGRVFCLVGGRMMCCRRSHFVSVAVPGLIDAVSFVRSRHIQVSGLALRLHLVSLAVLSDRRCVVCLLGDGAIYNCLALLSIAFRVNCALSGRCCALLFVSSACCVLLFGCLLRAVLLLACLVFR